MSKLTIRRWQAADEVVLTTIPLANRLDIRALNGPNVHIFIALENNAVVGIALGRASPGGMICFLDYIRSLTANRWDIFLALMRRHAQNGIDTGHIYAEARIPMATNCTNVGNATVLTGELTAKAGLAWEDDGRDVGSGTATSRKTRPVLLADLVPRLDAALKSLKCTVIYA